MVTLKLSVHGQHIKLKGDLPRCTVSDTVNYFRCEFTFDETWSDFNDISVYFKNMSSGIVKSCRLAADGSCYIPWEVLQNTGVVVANAIGILMNGDTVVRKLPTFPVELFVQVEEGQTQVSPSEDPTPTRYEQFIGEVHGAVDDAKSFAEAAKFAYYRIRDMKASAFGIPYDHPPAVTVVEGGQGGSFELVFAIPKGEPGEAGEDGRGIVSIDKTGTEDLVDTYTITYSDGTTSTYQVTNGSAGIVRWSDIVDRPDLSNYVPKTRRINGRALDKDISIYSFDIECDRQSFFYEVTVQEALDWLNDNKVGKVSGKGLSSNDYTASDKEIVTTLSDRASTDGYTYVFRRNDTGKGIWGAVWSDDIMHDRNVTVDDALRNKVDKVAGKGLSTNDFTTVLKNKLDGIASGAEVNVQADWNQTNVNADDYIKNKPTIPEGVKLYSATGQSTDGAMTQKATTAALNGKANSSHDHDDRYYDMDNIDALLDSKVDKVSGKGLSANDFTNTYVSWLNSSLCVSRWYLDDHHAILSENDAVDRSLDVSLVGHKHGLSDINSDRGSILTTDDLGVFYDKAGGTDYTTDLSSGTDTVKNIASISLPPGLWLISARCRFTPTASGAHVTSVGLTLASAGEYPQDRRYGSSTYYNQHNLVNIIDLRNNTGDTTIYLTGKSSVAGSWIRSSNTALSLRAVKVPVVD